MDIFIWHYYFPNVSSCPGTSCRIIPTLPTHLEFHPFLVCSISLWSRFLSGLWSVLLIYLSYFWAKTGLSYSRFIVWYLLETISFILLYLKTIFCYAYIFSLPEYSFFCQNLLKTLLEILFGMCSSIEGNWLLYNMEFSHPGTSCISVFILAFFYALQKNFMIFSNRFCTFFFMGWLYFRISIPVLCRIFVPWYFPVGYG